MSYEDFFKHVTRGESDQNGFKPMDRQIRLACGNDADPTKPETLKRGMRIQALAGHFGLLNNDCCCNNTTDPTLD
jgi:hypothetical protein